MLSDSVRIKMTQVLKKPPKRKTPKRVVLVNRDSDVRREMTSVLERAGYTVHPYSDGKSALGDILHVIEEPFVLLGEFSMGGIYTADEMRRCLDFHAKRTGADYGIISLGVPKADHAREALDGKRILYTHEKKPGNLIGLVSSESERIK